MAQMKEQIKTPEKELNEMEITNLSDVEFQIPQRYKKDPVRNEGYTN